MPRIALLLIAGIGFENNALQRSASVIFVQVWIHSTTPMSNAYHQLNFRSEPPATYHRRLLAFALANRFEKASHSRWVADQIVRLGLISAFRRFTPPPINF